MKVTEIHPVIESLTVIIDDIKYYQEINLIKKYKEHIQEDYEVGFKGRIAFDVDLKTGDSSTCTNLGKWKFSMGSSYWEEHFKKQVPTIKRLIKKAVKDYKKKYTNWKRDIE